MPPFETADLQVNPETPEVSGFPEVSNNSELSENMKFGFSNIQEQFADYGAEYLEPLLYWDEALGLSPLEEEKVVLVLSIFESYKDNPDLKEYIESNYIPYDVWSLEDFISNFPLEWDIDSNLLYEVDVSGDDLLTGEQIGIQNVDLADQTEDNNLDVLDTRVSVVDELIASLWEKWIYNAVLDWVEHLEGEDKIKFLEDNYAKLLEAAQNHSNTEFVRLYEQLDWLQTSGVLVLEWFDSADWQRIYSDAQLAIDPEHPSIWPGDVEQARVALGDSDVTDVSGNTIRGSNGEVVDVSWDTAVLSLESGDLQLEVGEVRNLDTRDQEVQITRLEQERVQNTEIIERNTVEISSKNADISRLENMSPESFDDIDMPNGEESPRDAETRKFTSKLSHEDRLSFIRQSENASGETFKLLLIGWLRESVLALSTQNRNLDERNSEITEQVGFIRADIAAKRDRESLRISMLKDKVEKSLAFINKLGVSPVIEAGKDAFDAINTWNPIYLPSWDIVTSIDFATMTFEWTFDPPLVSNRGSDDLNTQKIVAQIMNLAVSWDATKPISINDGGVPQYDIPGKDWSDKSNFINYIQPIVWSWSFAQDVKNRLASGNNNMEQ